MSDLTWQKGGEATLLTLRGDAVSVRSSVPWPPGSRIDGTLGAEPAAVVRVKVHGCKRQEDGGYVIDGRLLDAPRALRERLEALVAS